jgi:hypothetical protein
MSVYDDQEDSWFSDSICECECKDGETCECLCHILEQDEIEQADDWKDEEE